MSFIPIADYTFQKVHQISQIEFSPYSFREIYEMNKNPGMILGIILAQVILMACHSMCNMHVMNSALFFLYPFVSHFFLMA